ncbi:dihydroneopterin aldolase [Bacteroidota bacterium]|nr:dihydroneopterin aldolase [Bacteroidota bacterium]MDC3114825.1 dihydroneopterin aldolase [Bacteroidota bacterium]
MTKLNIKGVKIYAFHGHFEEEKKLGGHFIVNLEIGFNSDKVISTDKLEDTIDYVQVIDIVKKQMKTTKNLIESAADEILDELFKLDLIQSVNIEIEKISPPVDANFEKISVELFRSK